MKAKKKVKSPLKKPKNNSPKHSTPIKNSFSSTEQSEGKILYQHICKSKFEKLLPLFGLTIMNFCYSGGMLILVLLAYMILIHHSVLCFLIFCFIMIIPTIQGNRRIPLLLFIAKQLNFPKWFNRFEVIADEEFSDKKVIFPWMPHSVFTFPLWFSMFVPGDPFKQKVLISRGVLRFPFIGNVTAGIGIQAVEAVNFKKLMRQGQNISFVPGGFEEATIFHHKEYRIYDGDRKGFIKYAIQNGYNIHPVFIFGERKGYWTHDIFMNFRLKLNKYKLPGTLFFSKYFLAPNCNIDIYIVIGKKIELKKEKKPSNKTLSMYYDIYKREVQNLFDKYVDKCDPGAKLVWWKHNRQLKQQSKK